MKKIFAVLIPLLIFSSCEIINTIYITVTVDVWNMTANPNVMAEIDNTQKEITPGEYETWELEWTETEKTSFFKSDEPEESEEETSYSVSISISNDSGYTWSSPVSEEASAGSHFYVIINEGYFSITDDIYEY